MLRQLATHIVLLALAAAGPVACAGSDDSPADAGSVASGSGGAAASGGHTSGGGATGGGGDGGTGGSASGSGGAGAGETGTGGAGTGGTGGTGDGGAGAGEAGTGGAGAGEAGTGGAGDGGAGGAGAGCPGTGGITYTLAKVASPTAEQQSAYDKITSAMDEALSYYNCQTSIEKRLSVSYVPSVATADGNVNGSIRFGATSSMNYITAMHEIGHTVGVGSREFGALVVDGVFTGEAATRQLRAITGNESDVVHTDSTHFWPYGLNYTTEVKTTDDLVNHCKMVVAIREDIGF
ncbi:hypothetical protein WME79_28765 [Sorangium sp. So ce726]|uniref:hypothetical protein n=1 Tax=Sorangium sp. So ce726 TaxID=3133319 RepID=UPI003F63EF34